MRARNQVRTFDFGTRWRCLAAPTLSRRSRSLKAGSANDGERAPANALRYFAAGTGGISRSADTRACGATWLTISRKGLRLRENRVIACRVRSAMASVT